MKALVPAHSRYGRKGGANKSIVDNTLVCEFHFNANDINISFVKSKNSLKRSAVPSFMKLKEDPVYVKEQPLQLEERLKYLKGGGIPGNRFYAGNK